MHMLVNTFLSWTSKAFSIKSCSCYFCEVETPAFMAFVFNSLPKAPTGSDLCFKRNCQTHESRGSLESLLIKTETSQTDIPQYPLLMSKQVWFCLEKKLLRLLSNSPKWFLPRTSSSNKIIIRVCDMKDYCCSHQNDVGNLEATSCQEEQRLKEVTIPPDQKWVWLMNHS